MRKVLVMLRVQLHLICIHISINISLHQQILIISLRQIDSHKIHFFTSETLLNYHPCQPKALDGLDRTTFLPLPKHYIQEQTFLPLPKSYQRCFQSVLSYKLSGEWFMKEITIRYRTKDPIADKRADHADAITIVIREIVASHWYFWVILKWYEMGFHSLKINKSIIYRCLCIYKPAPMGDMLHFTFSQKLWHRG